MIFRLLFWTVLVQVLAGCSVIGAFNAIIPSSGFERQAEIAYGTHERQKLDIYRPKSQSDRARPVVVFFYGGSWDSGSKNDYLFVAEALTAQGWIAVVPDYRLYPEVRFPGFLGDAAQAMRWTRDNIRQHGGDTTRIFAMGHSAGAHIAAMLSFDGSYLKTVNMAPRDLAGFIGLAGPYDFLPLKSERLKVIFGPEPDRPRSQPINFVTRDAPPALLLHGDGDTIVGPHNSINLAQRIRERGGSVTHVRIPDLGHRGIVLNLSAPLRGGKPELPAIAEFINGSVQTRLSAD